MRFIFSILLLTFTFLANSQNYYSRNITSREGLPDESIRKIFEDSRGILWIGTDAGVCRWDGKTFTTYNTLDGLAGNKIWWIDEDRAGNIWFACFGSGISYFDGKNFTTYTEKEGLVDNAVRVVKYSKKYDCMAIGTGYAISIMKDSVFYNFSQKNGSVKQRAIVTGILENNRGIEFYCFGHFHYSVSFTNGKPAIELLDDERLSEHGVSIVYRDKNGDDYFGWGYKGLLHKHQGQYIEIPKVGEVFGIAEDALGNIWAASWNGSGLNGVNGGLSMVSHNKPKYMNRLYGFSSKLGWSVYYEKKQHQVFYGTLDKGFYKIPPPYFEYYSSSYFGEKELTIKDIEVDADNNLWFITDSLLVNWNKDIYEKKQLVEFYRARIKYEKSLISSKRIVKNYKKDRTQYDDIEFDSKNNLWLSIHGLQFFKIPSDDRTKIEALPFDYYYRFEFDEGDTLFQSNDWDNFMTKYTNFKHTSDSVVYGDSLYKILLKELYSYKNEIWASSRISDVFMYKNGKLRVLTVEDTTINKIVNDICFDDEGYAYLAGVDGRIEILAPESRRKVFEVALGSPHYSVLWLKVARDMLFAGCSDGLRVYKLEDLKAKKMNHHFYSESEGYMALVVNSSVVDKNGDIWLGTNEGLMKIATKLFKAYKYSPLKTIIQKVEIFNEDVQWEDYGLADNWTGLPLGIPKLAPDQNYISIYFHTLNFINSYDDLYYYKLEGIDKDWNGPTDRTYVVYPYLNSGKYKFLVKSKNKKSGLFSQPAEFEFKIRTPLYKQVWCYFLLSVLFIALVTYLYQLKLKSMQKKERAEREVMHQISELKTKALQAQMNPHFLFNSLNSIQNFILDKDVDSALMYLSSFSKVIRMTLEFVDKKFVRLKDVLEYLQYYVSLENMRFDDLFEYTVEIDNSIDPDITMIPPMILQPVIENAIKHGLMLSERDGELKIIIERIDKESYKCIVEDNGVGRKRAEEVNRTQKIHKESLGIKITQERLNILNKNENGIYQMKIIDLFTESGEAAGTRVEITLADVFS